VSMTKPERAPDESGGEVPALRARLAELERLNREHERVAAALRDSEARYRRIVETAAEGIWAVDASWRTTFVNRSLGRMLGYEPGAMLGRHIFDFMDEEARRAALAYMARRERGVNEEHDFRFRRCDGSALWAKLSTAAVLDEGGRFAGALAMVMDVTERKRSEERLRDYADRLQALSRRLVRVQEE
jgi:PAS domain S-box-containing protein